MRLFPRASAVAAIAAVTVFAVVAAGCGTEDDTATDRPTIVVTTTILGDVVENLVGDTFDVVTIMPIGANPHDFQTSAQQVATIGEAELLIVNGAAFEEGLLDVIDAAEADGTTVFEATSVVDTIEFDESDHDHVDEDHVDEDHVDEDHVDEDHVDEDPVDEDPGHDHEGADPHFWTDPTRMADAADGIVAFLLSEVDEVDAEELRSNAETYVQTLEALDTEVVEMLTAIDDEHRVMVTNHGAFGYLADRYGFEIVGTVIPSGTTTGGTSARQLAELAEVIEHEGVPAIFAETTASTELAQTLAEEVGGDISVVELFTGSLGEPGSGAETYVDMVRTNTQRIVDALGA